MAATVESHHFDETSLHKDHFRAPSTPTTPRQQLPATIHDGSVAPERNLALEPSSDSAIADGPSRESAPELHTHGTSQTGTPLADDSRPPLSSSAQGETWVSMDVDDPDDDQDGSDNDTENGEAGTPTKKKKGQRFFCTGYPPCNLSFTRSEHLARHIRKHTGERPFQCHCSRRFSRLDNLRQHAQTVHVNEEIPTDSLAATGTRFQRQIRTDRVRPAGRPRTNTMSSTSSHGRAHSRNLSASSIGSTSSNFSTSADARRRPPPLLMPNDSGNRPKLGLEPPSTPPAQYRGFTSNSPGDMGTPTSSTYSVTPGSPGYVSSVGSPISSSARAGGFFGNRTPGRRLSVPSGASPFSQSFVGPYSGQYMTAMAPPSTGNLTSSSIYPSPVSSTFSYAPAYQVSPGEDWRRRTWHPSTYPAAAFNYSRPATSGLSYSQTPDAPQPAFAQNATAAAGQAPRLPGIESFDQVQHRPSTPPRRGPSPMQLDVTPYPGDPVTGAGNFQSGPHYSGQRQSHVSWEPLQKTIYQSSSDQIPMPRDATSWSHQTINEIRNVVSSQESGIAVGTTSAAPKPGAAQQQQIARDALQVQNIQPTRNKRNGWYNGPMLLTRTSPEGSSSSEGVTTPGTSSAEVNPVIVHSNGYIEPHHAVLAADVQANPCMPPPGQVPPYATRQDDTTRRAYYTDDRRDGRDMGRLEALVAVATGEDKAATSIR